MLDQRVATAKRVATARAKRSKRVGSPSSVLALLAPSSKARSPPNSVRSLLVAILAAALKLQLDH